MMNNHYNSRAGDFNNLKEQSIDVIYTEGLRRLEGYITTLGTIDSIIRSSGISSENISTLSKTYQGETPMDSIIARSMNLDIQEYHRLRGLAPRIHGELIQNIDSQLSYQFSVLLNQITANNGDNKYITGIEGEREVTITGYDEYGTPTEYTYIEKYNLSLDELMDVENTPVQAIQDYYIEKVNLYRYGVLEGDYTPEQKQEIFNQSIGDTATNFYTGDLGEFIIQDSTEDRLRKEAYEKDIGWKQIISWATLAISIIAIPLTWGASLAISGVSMFVMAGTVMTVTAAGWMAFTAGYSFITGYDFYTGERLTDNEKWIKGMIALASAIPVIGRLAKTVRWMDGLSKIGSKAAQFFFNFGDDALDILGGIIKYNDTGDLFGSIMHGAVGILSFSGAGLYGLVRKLSGLKNVKTLLESFDQLSDADLKSRLKGMDDNQIKNFFKQLDDVSLKRAINVFDDVDLKGLLKNLDDTSIKRIINSLGDTDLKGVFKNLDDTDITMLKKYLLGGGDTELLENIVISIKNGDTIDLDSSLLKKIKGSGDLPELEIPFKANPNHDYDEFKRQLSNQEDGLNDLTVQEYLDNRVKYLKEGRSVEGTALQQKFRDNFKKDMIDDLLDEGLSYSDAKKIIDDFMSTKSVLHDPDQVVGGYGNKMSGLGDTNVNTSIGSQWKSRVKIIDKYIDEISQVLSVEELLESKLNIKLIP